MFVGFSAAFFSSLFKLMNTEKWWDFLVLSWDFIKLGELVRWCNRCLCLALCSYPLCVESCRLYGSGKSWMIFLFCSLTSKLTLKQKREMKSGTAFWMLTLLDFTWIQTWFTHATKSKTTIVCKRWQTLDILSLFPRGEVVFLKPKLRARFPGKFSLSQWKFRALETKTHVNFIVHTNEPSTQPLKYRVFDCLLLLATP